MFDPLILTEIVKGKQHTLSKVCLVSAVPYIFLNQNSTLGKLINLFKN